MNHTATNLSELAQKIKSLDTLTSDEKAALIELLNGKKYGLVWENKPEDVEEQLRTQLPILHEVTEKRILSPRRETEIDPSYRQGDKVRDNSLSSDLSFRRNLTTAHTLQLDFGTDLRPQTGQVNLPSPDIAPPLGAGEPNHTLIEGDNLHALTVLNYTHAGAIDVIYIDPPYNTGNKDFKYNDRFIDREDGYRHSKWLSFMDKRLRLAKNLLKDSGVIFISIDDNEQAQLKLLCDEIFGEENFVANVSVINNLKGRSDEKYIATAHESLLIYKKQSFETLGLPAPEEYIEEYKFLDDLGKYRLLGLRKRGDNSLREDRPNLFYPIYYDLTKNEWSLNIETFSNPVEIIPKLSDGSEGNWRWGKDTLLKRKDEIVIQKVKKRNEFDVFQKDYLHKSNDELKRVKPKSFWSGSEFSSDAGTKSLKEIMADVSFRSPKPIGLIKCCLEQSSHKSAKVLDFFAGSGTTLHAVMALNAEDGGSRECILVTNNENNICEEVTYERNKRVIQGYHKGGKSSPLQKGEGAGGEVSWVAGLSGNNLRYYKTGYVGREKTLANKRALMALATEILCLKEGVYEEKDLADFENLPSLSVRVFQANDRAFMVVYDDTYIPQAVSIVQALSAELLPNALKVYVFSEGQDPYTEDFEEVAEWVQLVALPDAIYRAFQHLLPREGASVVIDPS